MGHPVVDGVVLVVLVVVVVVVVVVSELIFRFEVTQMILKPQ